MKVVILDGYTENPGDLDSVSYTHLDVYKRQAWDCSCLEASC